MKKLFSVAVCAAIDRIAGDSIGSYTDNFYGVANDGKNID